MKYEELNKDKGVAGLTLLTSVVVSLFLIGIIIMAFVIAGSELQDTLTDEQNASKLIINDTQTALGDVVDWFPTFIVLAAVVVLILFIVVIIGSIRGTGMTQGGA